MTAPGEPMAPHPAGTTAPAPAAPDAEAPAAEPPAAEADPVAPVEAEPVVPTDAGLAGTPEGEAAAIEPVAPEPVAPIEVVELAVPEPVAPIEVVEAAIPEPIEPAPAEALETEPPTALPAPAPEAPDLLPVEVAPEPGALVPLAEVAPAIAAVSVSRRRFLGFGLSIAGGLAGMSVLGRLFPVFEEAAPPPIVPAYDPRSKAWTFVVDTAACIGCGLCVAACKEENHVPEEPALTRTWVERHVTTADGAVYVDSPAGGIDGFPPDSVAPGAEGKAVASSFFEPRLCMQCEESPCTKVCPVGATYRTADGVILVDARRCIGCGYCVVACPYGARYIVPAGADSPSGVAGVADKCTWCYHRISQGRLPACVEVCPVGARRFGDASDPNGEIATLVRERRPRMLHPEYGTRPRVLYLGPAVEEA